MFSLFPNGNVENTELTSQETKITPDEVVPLPELLRPQSLEDVIGQSHLLGIGKPLRLAFQSGKPHSMIFWGPPGVGKTTLARLTAKYFKCEFIALSAVLAGVKDIRAAIEQAQKNKENNLVPILQQVLVGQLSQPISWGLQSHLNIVNTLFIRFLNKNESISIDSI